MAILKEQVLYGLKIWTTLTRDQQMNFHKNTRYIIQVINQCIHRDRGIKAAGTLPFMQLQGETTYCGVCAFNNLVGKESISVNDIADDMWLQQFENMGNSQCIVTKGH